RPNATGYVERRRVAPIASHTTVARKTTPTMTRTSATPSTSFQSLSALRYSGAPNAAMYRSDTQGCVRIYRLVEVPPAVHVGGVRFCDHTATTTTTANDG